MYLGFEKDVFKTIADYYNHLKEPLLTFHLFDAFVSVLGKWNDNEHCCLTDIESSQFLLPLDRLPLAKFTAVLK